ncbi:hypothetical protein JKH83_004670 [Salmonella enterica]|nr:hypothetical protein [Salmonella enterica]
MTAGISNNLVRQVNVPPPGVKRRGRESADGWERPARNTKAHYAGPFITGFVVNPLRQCASGCE